MHLLSSVRPRGQEACRCHDKEDSYVRPSELRRSVTLSSPSVSPLAFICAGLGFCGRSVANPTVVNPFLLQSQKLNSTSEQDGLHVVSFLPPKAARPVAGGPSRVEDLFRSSPRWSSLLKVAIAPCHLNSPIKRCVDPPARGSTSQLGTVLLS